jgi:hypothetical protein
VPGGVLVHGGCEGKNPWFAKGAQHVHFKRLIRDSPAFAQRFGT